VGRSIIVPYIPWREGTAHDGRSLIVQPRRLYRSRDKQDCLARNVNLPDVCTANGAWTLRNAKQPVPFYLRAPLGRPFGLPLCPGLNGTSFFSVAAVTDFSVGAATDFPRVLAISPSEFMLCSQHKITQLSRGSIPFFPTTRAAASAKLSCGP
jgi:hypothetical protein